MEKGDVMNYYPIRYVAMGLVTVMLMLVMIGTAVAQSVETVYINSPTEGETLSGVITINGAADFPDFLKYEIFLKSGDNMLWVATGFSPVINGALARMDTKIFMDGSYQLLIRKVTSDSNYTDFVGPTITLANNLGAPRPHSEVETNILYPPQNGQSVGRIRNCTGADMEFDYIGDDFGCSHGNLWIMPKLQDAAICPYQDVFLAPDCKYRGTAVTIADEVGATYEYDVIAGKVYEFEYVGGGRLFITEGDGEDRTASDVGGLLADDPIRIAASGPQVVPAAETSSSNESTASTTTSSTSDQQADATTDAVLPESGQAASQTNPYFMISGVILLLLMLTGGLLALRRGKPVS